MPDTTLHISSFAPHCDECPRQRTGVAGSDGAWLACRCQHHAICRQCGWPITDDDSHSDHHDLCALCDTDDLMRGRPPEERHELSALLAALGLSPDTSVTFQLLRGAELDDDWGDYRIEWAMIPEVAWRCSPTGQVIAHPVHVQLPGWDAPRIILRWRQWHPGTPEFLERSWALEQAHWVERIQVRASGRFPSRRAFEEFASLSWEPNKLGRKPDDLEHWLTTELRPAIAAAIAIGHRPDQGAIAERVGLSPSGLRKKLDQLNTRRRRSGQQRLLWRHLVAEIQATPRQ